MENELKHYGVAEKARKQIINERTVKMVDSLIEDLHGKRK